MPGALCHANTARTGQGCAKLATSHSCNGFCFEGNRVFGHYAIEPHDCEHQRQNTKYHEQRGNPSSLPARLFDVVSHRVQRINFDALRYLSRVRRTVSAMASGLPVA